MSLHESRIRHGAYVYQGFSLRAIWMKYSPQGQKFRPILVSGRSGSLPKKKKSCQHTIDKLCCQGLAGPLGLPQVSELSSHPIRKFTYFESEKYIVHVSSMINSLFKHLLSYLASWNETLDIHGSTAELNICRLNGKQ